MRIKRRAPVIGALAVTAALALAGLALASGTSTVSFKFSPSNVPKSTFQKGKINLHTHTTYTGATQTDKAKLNFDNDFKFNTGAAPKCDKSKLSGNKTMKQAMAACKRALIGTGTATAKAGSNTVHACVLVFNGKGTGGHILLFTRAQASPPFTIDCSNPSSNTNGNTTVLLDGALSANPTSLGGDFKGGKQLLFRNITQASPLPLTDFNVTVKKGSYVSARCHDTNHKWNLKTTFTYLNPAGTQSVNSSQTCS
jgi:hypothetical protein